MILPTSYVPFDTLLGPLWVVGDAQGVTHVVYHTESFLSRYPEIKKTRGGVLGEAANAVKAFLAGKTSEFSVPLYFNGTDFQCSVWEALLAIPYGQTSTYTEIAAALGKPKSFRAVANACGQNPLPLIVPCHRVVHKDKSVSGFAWGVEVKKKLLAMEREVMARTNMASGAA